MRPLLRRVLIAVALVVAGTAAAARAEFVRGLYVNGMHTYDTAVALGCNMVVSGPAWETDLVRARELGLRVIPSWYGDDERADRLFAALDTDPIVMAWYPFDEPEIYGYSPAVVAAKIGRLRTISPSKPVYLTVFHPSRYAAYFGLGDIIGITPYPIGGDTLEIRPDIPGRYSRRARALAPDKPLLVCLPAFFQRPWQYRAPTPRELHNYVYQALTGDPDGIVFFGWQVQGLDGVIWNLGEHPELLAAIGRINRELAALDTALVRSLPVTDAVPGPGPVFHRVVDDGEGLVWILANPRDTGVTASLDLPVRAAGRCDARVLHGEGVVLGVTENPARVLVNLEPLGYAAVRIEPPPR